MFRVKPFTICKCGVSAVTDRQASDVLSHRFCCGNIQRTSNNIKDTRSTCDYSLTIDRVRDSTTIPKYYEFEIKDEDNKQRFESFHRKPLRAYLEFVGVARRKTLERALQIIEGSNLRLPKHSISPVVVDVVEKEDRQELLIRLLLYSYITVIEERIRLQVDRDDDDRMM